MQFLQVLPLRGFIKEGVLRSHAWGDGEYRDVAIMGILRDEFQI